jgi:hypothetical protein
VFVDLAQAGMAMPLQIVARPAQEPGQIVELLDTGMGDAMPP